MFSDINQKMKNLLTNGIVGPEVICQWHICKIFTKEIILFDLTCVKLSVVLVVTEFIVVTILCKS